MIYYLGDIYRIFLCCWIASKHARTLNMESVFMFCLLMTQWKDSLG